MKTHCKPASSLRAYLAKRITHCPLKKLLTVLMPLSYSRACSMCVWVYVCMCERVTVYVCDSFSAVGMLQGEVASSSDSTSSQH